VSLVSLLTEQKPLGRDALYWHFPGYLGAGGDSGAPRPAARSAAATTSSRVLRGRPLELYNLKDDIGQKNNLAQSQPEKAKELHDKLVAWA
jgi:hypothetical protein